MKSPRKKEAKTVIKVQMLCGVTKDSAETAGRTHEILDTDEEFTIRERERYVRNKERAIKLAEALIDEFYRDAALHHIIDLCMTAKDADAIDLLKKVRTEFIREKIIEAYPSTRRPTDDARQHARAWRAAVDRVVP